MRGDLELGDVLADIGFGRGDRRDFLRQQPAPDQHQVSDADHGQQCAEAGEFKHAESGQAVLLGEAVGKQVRRGADQGADATHLRGIGHRQQHPRRRGAGVRADAQGQRQEGRDQGDVLDEGTHWCDRQHQRQRQQPWLADAGEHAPEWLQRPRALDAKAQGKHGGDRDCRLVAETGQCLGRCNQLQDNQQDEDDQRNQVDAHLLAGEQGHRSDHDNQGHPLRQGHCIALVSFISMRWPSTCGVGSRSMRTRRSNQAAWPVSGSAFAQPGEFRSEGSSSLIR